MNTKYSTHKLKKAFTKSRTRKVMLIISSLAVLIVFINRFTTVNLNFSTFNSNKIPDLFQPLENEFYQIERVTYNTWNEIRYDPSNDFYLIAENDKITKLDGKGYATFVLNMNEKDIYDMPDFMYYHRPSYFVISWYGIYDLSKEKPYLEKFHGKINEDGKMELEEWTRQFNHLYKTSEIALWGYKKSIDAERSHPLYFRQNGKWKILYTLKNAAQINNDTFTKFRLNYKQDYISDKFHKLYLLKDIQKDGAYSDYNNFDNTYDNSNYSENKMHYGKQANIKTLSFKKENYQEAPYSYIPTVFGGTAVNRLTIRNSDLTFKTKATKGAGFNSEKLSTYFYVFEVPTKFKTKNSLSFLYYKYPTNWNSDENEGVFVIRKRFESTKTFKKKNKAHLNLN